MCSLPNGIRTRPVTNDVVADSRDQPNQRAHSTNVGTVTTTHGLPVRVARNALAGPVPSTCEAAQPPRPLTTEYLADRDRELGRTLASRAVPGDGDLPCPSVREADRAKITPGRLVRGQRGAG